MKIRGRCARRSLGRSSPRCSRTPSRWSYLGSPRRSSPRPRPPRSLWFGRREAPYVRLRRRAISRARAAKARPAPACWGVLHGATAPSLDETARRLTSAIRQRRRDARGPARRRALPRRGARLGRRGREAPPRVRYRARVRTRGARGLGLPPSPLGSGTKGEPLWPPGVVGSITHCEGYRACAIARSSSALMLGIDAERNAPLRDGVWEEVAHGRERQLRGADAGGGYHLDATLFSAKEAIFKAWYPLARRWLGFGDAEVRIDAPARSPLACSSRDRRSPARRSGTSPAAGPRMAMSSSRPGSSQPRASPESPDPPPGRPKAPDLFRALHN